MNILKVDTEKIPISQIAALSNSVRQIVGDDLIVIPMNAELLLDVPETSLIYIRDAIDEALMAKYRESIADDIPYEDSPEGQSQGGGSRLPDDSIDPGFYDYFNETMVYGL